MNFCLSFGSITLDVYSDILLKFLPGTIPFLAPAESEQSTENRKYAGEQEFAASKIIVRVIFADQLPSIAAEVCGDDNIFRYYRKGDRYYDLAMPGMDGSVSLVCYSADFREVTLYVNEGAFPGIVRTVDKVLQLLPMKQMLVHYGAFLLHSSRICLDGKAILFTAPSQTGKSTQARLWQKYEGARITGNDRTLLWEKDGMICTGGYPVDGSSPIYSNEDIELGAIVVLHQGADNRVQRLSAVNALRALMEQTVLDAWSGQERAAAQQFWLRMMESCPVYELFCRPEEGAVSCLRDQLIRDEVIADGVHSG